MRAKSPFLVPPEFFRRQPAHALDKAALDLAEVDSPVQRPAGVVKDVGALDDVFAGQRVDRHFRAGRAIGKIIEWPALPLVAVPVDFRRLVEACRRELDSRHVGLLDHVGESDFLIADAHAVRQEHHLFARHLIFFGGEIDKPVLDLPRSVLRRHAVEVGAGGSSGGRRVRHLAGRRRCYLHLIEVDLKLFRHHLRDLEVEPLPHLRAAVVQMHRAVGIYMHQRAGLVVVRGSEGDAELHRRQRDAALHVAAVVVEGRDRAAAACVVAALLQFGDDALDDVVLDRLVIGRDVAVALLVAHGP